MLRWHADTRLDQGLSDNYSCPTCRKPLFVGTPEGNSAPHSGDVSSDEQLARQLSSTLELQNIPAGVIPNQIQTPVERDEWRFAPKSIKKVFCRKTKFISKS
jgi:autocrine motility factor receptor